MRILIADDHELMRRGLRSLLSLDDSLEICGEAVDGRDAIEKARELQPDVIVMDISMPNMDGLQATRTVRQSIPNVEVLILSQHDSKEMIHQAFKAGARGYVVKSAISQDLVTALRVVARHEFFSANSLLAAGSSQEVIDTKEILLKEAALERALRESEERFRWTFEQAAVGMVHATPRGRILRVNQKLCDILGYTREELLKARLKDLTHPADVAATSDCFDRLIAGQMQSFSLVKRYIHKNGSAVWGNATVSMVRDTQGNTDYVMGVIIDITEQKQAEATLSNNIAETMIRLELAQYDLQQKDEQLRAALAASDTATFRWNAGSGDLVDFNESAKRLFGFAREESVTNTEQLTGRVHPDDLPVVEAATARCREGRDLEVENRIILPGGPTRWLFARGKVTLDQHGQAWVVGAATDITKRKEAEEAARQSDENRKFALEAARVAEWDLDIATQNVKRSLLHDQIFGYESLRPHWTVDTFLQHVHPDDRETVQGVIQRSAAGGPDLDYECRIILPDGSVRWVWAHGAKVRDVFGKTARMIGITMDITDRKRTEEALRKSVFRFQRFVESNVIGIVIADTMHIIEANDVFLDILDYTRDDLAAGKVDWLTLTPPEHAPRDLGAIQELKSMGACSPYEKDLIRKDGERVPILMGATVLNASPLEWMCFVVDLSELKEVERKLREARDELEHRVEIRTRELVKTLSNLQAEVKIRKEAEGKMRELSARLLHLQDEERRRIARDLHDTVGQTLSALKMTSDSLKRHIESNTRTQKLFEDLDALTAAALEEIRTTSHLLHPPLLDEIGFASAARWFIEGLAKRGRIEIEADIQFTERLPTPLELALFRVLQESLTNIHKHSGSSAASIHCKKKDGNVVMAIKDNGKGITPEVLDLFQRDGVATGVGLAGMQERVRELGGKLEIDSGPGGTMVRAIIPIPISGAPVDGAEGQNSALA